MKFTGTGHLKQRCGVLLGALAFFSGTGLAQVPCAPFWRSMGGPYVSLDRTLELAKRAPVNTAGLVRSGLALVQNCATLSPAPDSARRFEWSLLPAGLMTHHNSNYPTSDLDGARWSGGGLSSTLIAGAMARWGPITAAIAPVITYHQNEDFNYLAVPNPEFSRYSNYFHAGTIDLPQRFGSDALFAIQPGQSFVRVDAYGLAAGFSTENMRWGPARRNPIILSDAGAGFPHFFAGTSGPFDLKIMHVSVEAVWGHLGESNFFDTLSINDDRLFAGIIATFTPKSSGLTIGVARSYMRGLPRNGLSLTEQIFGPYTGITENPSDTISGDNQLVSVFLTWALPDAGFEAYGEYAREDHWEDGTDLLMQLDHSRGYTIGFEKVFTFAERTDVLRVAGEATNLGKAPTWQARTTGATFYMHTQVRQGYTHRGQLLGAPIGPGSDAQFVSADYLGASWQSGLFYNRARYDNDVHYEHFGNASLSYRGHDTERTFGLRGGRTMRDVQLVYQIAFSKRYNRGFVDLITANEYTSEQNVSFTLGGAWTPGARLKPQSERAQ